MDSRFQLLFFLLDLSSQNKDGAPAWQWKHQILITRPTGNSLDSNFLIRTLSQISPNYMQVHYLFLYLIQDSTLYLTALSSFSFMQQILANSLFIFILLQIFSNFPCKASQVYPSFKSGHLISKYMGFCLKYL